MPAASSCTHPKRILVVDDDPVVRQMLARVLVESGYHAVAVATGSEAIEALGDLGSVDVALVDVELPGESGWTTLAAMRRQVPALTAIIITAWPHQQAAAREAGASGCFEKPLDFAGLLLAIDRAIEAQLAGSADARGSTIQGSPPSPTFHCHE